MLQFALAALLAVPVSLPSLQSNPAPAAGAQSEEFLKELRGRLKAHPYFSKIVLSEKSLSPTLTLFSQAPQVAEPDWEAKLIAERSPWFVRAEQQFVERFAKPLGLQRRADMPITAVCTLQTFGDYANYFERATSISPYLNGGHFDRRQRWLVMYESGGRHSPANRRTTQMGEFVVALVQAHQTIGTTLTPRDLVVFSIASYLCEDLGPTAESLGNCPPPPRMAEAIVTALARPDTAYACILKLDELAEHSSWERYWSLASQRAKELNVTLDGELAGLAFHSQGVLWTHFLMDANQGRDRARFLTFLRYAMQGQSSGSALRGTFEGVQVDQLTREFLAWVVALDASARRAAPLPPGTIEGLFKGPPALAKSAPKGAAPAPVAAQPKGPDLERLRTPATDLETQHGLALARAAAGHLGEAARRVGELAALAKDATERDRLERERARLVALDTTRTAILNERIASAKKLQFSLPDKKLVVSVRALDGEWMLLGENRQGLERLPLSDFSLELLAKELPSPAPEAWMKPYLQLLAGDARAAKGLGEGTKLADLRADATALSERVQRARAATDFDALANRGLPTEPKAARDACDAVERLLKAHSDSPLLEARREALRDYARAAYAVLFEPKRIAELWGGKVEALEDGQIRWTLDFDKPEDAALFSPVAGVWPSYRAKLEDAFKVPAGSLAVNGGRLAIRGGGAWMAPATFSEISSCDVLGMHSYKLNGTCAINYVLVAYKGVESFVAFTVIGDLVVTDEIEGVTDYQNTNASVLPNRPYTSRLARADGKWSVKTEFPTVKVAEDCVASNGQVVLFSHHTETFLLDSISVTGRADVSQAAAVWAEQQCKRIGL